LQSKALAPQNENYKNLSGAERRFVTDTNHVEQEITESDYKVFVWEATKNDKERKTGEDLTKKLVIVIQTIWDFLNIKRRR